MLSLAPRPCSQITAGSELQEKLGSELEERHLRKGWRKDVALGIDAGEYAQGRVAISGRDGPKKHHPAAMAISSAPTGPLISTVTHTDGTKWLLSECTLPC